MPAGVKTNLATAARVPALVQPGARISAAEIFALLACGALAAAAVAFVHVPLKIPGHAILRAVLPMALGLALVPRKSAGLLMMVGAALTVGGLHLGGVGKLQPAAVVGLLTLGPLLDAAMIGEPRGWKLYVRFVAAGVAANLLAFVSRYAIAALGWDLGSREFRQFWLVALGSYLLAGAMAGLISAALWFKARQ